MSRKPNKKVRRISVEQHTGLGVGNGICRSAENEPQKRKRAKESRIKFGRSQRAQQIANRITFLSNRSAKWVGYIQKLTTKTNKTTTPSLNVLGIDRATKASEYRVTRLGAFKQKTFKSQEYGILSILQALSKSILVDAS
jgi:hypothetical protein